MATISEDYVSFETAKLLKEKGFDEGCRAHYGTAGSFSYEKYEVESSECEMHNAILAPTLQMAMKWLREVHNIDISIIPLRSQKEYLPRIESDTISHDAIPCRKYEEACEVAIKYCLEHLI